MTATWTTHISEVKWTGLRRVLEENELFLPFHAGVTQNRKTGYTLSNRYDTATSQLTLVITYPGDANQGPSIREILVCLNRMFDSNGTITR